MWIDTHCHLDAAEFDADRDQVVATMRASGVAMAVLAAAHVEHFGTTRAVAHRYGFGYALGLHPLWIERAQEGDLEVLRAALHEFGADPNLVAVGEIGIDLWVPGLDTARQEWFYREQLKLARAAAAPVIVHVRRSADLLLKHLRQIALPGGIVHAFNGSAQQAQQFIDLGFKLGFGGALSYAGSQRIRHLAATVPATGWVLETDAPDMPAQWLRQAHHDSGAPLRNSPAELPRIGAEMAALRGMPLAAVAEQNRANAVAALPRLAALLAGAEART